MTQRVGEGQTVGSSIRVKKRYPIEDSFQPMKNPGDVRKT